MEPKGQAQGEFKSSNLCDAMSRPEPSTPRTAIEEYKYYYLIECYIYNTVKKNKGSLGNKRDTLVIKQMKQQEQ